MRTGNPTGTLDHTPLNHLKPIEGIDMDKNGGIEIVAADNGFIVMEPTKPGSVFSFREMKVFRSMSELQVFLADHFSYRGICVESDPGKP